LEIQRPVVGGRGLALREIWVGGGRGGGLKICAHSLGIRVCGFFLE